MDRHAALIDPTRYPTFRPPASPHRPPALPAQPPRRKKGGALPGPARRAPSCSRARSSGSGRAWVRRGLMSTRANTARTAPPRQPGIIRWRPAPGRVSTDQEVFGGREKGQSFSDQFFDQLWLRQGHRVVVRSLPEGEGAVEQTMEPSRRPAAARDLRALSSSAWISFKRPELRRAEPDGERGSHRSHRLRRRPEESTGSIRWRDPAAI